MEKTLPKELGNLKSIFDFGTGENTPN